MRDVLQHFFRPTKAEFSELWNTALISFDASSLLNIYRYSDATKENLIAVIKHYAPRIRLPHQFALEFARNRPLVVTEQIAAIDAIEKQLAGVDKRFQQRNAHPFPSEGSRKALSDIRDELSQTKRKFEKMVSGDEYVSLVLDWLNGKVGPKPSEAELAKLHSEADRRYGQKIPPGYEDVKDKGTPGAYGDYIAWSQLMKISADDKNSIILVIDDRKEDWWRKEKGRTVGPRPELLEEFRSVTSQRLWMYNSESFLRSAKKLGRQPVNDQTIAEVGASLLANSSILAIAKATNVSEEDELANDEASSFEYVEKTARPEKRLEKKAHPSVKDADLEDKEDD